MNVTLLHVFFFICDVFGKDTNQYGSVITLNMDTVEEIVKCTKSGDGTRYDVSNFNVNSSSTIINDQSSS